jgi:hypothetical protein
MNESQWQKFKEKGAVFKVGDHIIDRDEGGNGVVTAVGEWVVIKWQGMGAFSTPYDIAVDAIFSNDWEILSHDPKNPNIGDVDLSRLLPPKHDKIKLEDKISVGEIYEKINRELEITP